jgi:hypothetical protein
MAKMKVAEPVTLCGIRSSSAPRSMAMVIAARPAPPTIYSTGTSQRLERAA